MRLLYSLVFYLLMPFVLGRMLWRSRLAPAYRRRLGERLGFIPAPAAGEPVIWVHAVSVGETLAAAPLIEDLLARYPGHRLAVTTTTPTGSERVRALFGERVFHVYAPWDLPGAVRRFLKRLQPELLLVMETELWPNMLHHSKRRGCRILLANARLSERSARGYARLAPLIRQMLGQLDCVACQAREDGERFVRLGLEQRRLHITGSIKFDLELDAALRDRAAELRRDLGGDRRPVLLAASTHAGEDEQILAAFGELRRHGDCLLVLVPRHPERFDAVHELCRRAGWRVARRSREGVPGAGDDILLGDTMGELLLLLGTASVAVIGGSLVEHGGHNALEAAAWGVPVVTGPHMFNFEEISALLVTAGAMIRLQQPAALADTLRELLADAPRRRGMGEAGLRVVADNRGARERLLALVAEQLRPG
ncbi:lipid IV(A) 3-deoxy-D-manno-octulosonic acid transferase [Parahaliea mediterranea]|uniref:3-deoxy-D-manno-octulosonic acid transferase n=1 Tax=Parahaliea mediterranea TaxID=651086 RepID=A0A939DJ38_9GAMM|nr:lipid IV(A) 3-deoxy-D-manno-octulosonic acid transferase [Parahaliea mediterranea]MBN7799044.1 lipid IV(A) 3-deoxy-D-manno-octulosonic acid transferase [Parahaliea mediterranea]